MTNVTYTIDNSDRSNNNTFTVPGDEDGGAGDDSFAVDTDDVRAWDWYIHIDNQWDVNVDVTPRGSHHEDSTMAKAVEDGTTQTVNSGGNQHVFTGTSRHSYIDMQVNPAGTPSSGKLHIRLQRRK